jgi:4'-phosphopantetheinyl transferase
VSAVDLWYVRSGEGSAASLADGWRVLSTDERERAARFVFDRDRETYVLAHVLLRLALSHRAPVPPEHWRFRTGPYGRPEVAGSEDRLGLRFSLSHTVGLAVCTVTTGSPVGVDAEAMGRRVPLELAGRCLAPAERAALAVLPAAEQPERFLEHWTLKEAFLKALGIGLSYPLERISFCVAPGGAVEVELPDELGERREAWRFGSWRLEGGYRVALAIRSHGTAQRPEAIDLVAWDRRSPARQPTSVSSTRTSRPGA